MQYCRTVLPQGFENSPTLFGEALAHELQALQLEKGALLQYVDDLLITGDSKQDCLNNTVETLNHLAECGYKVSRERAQICKKLGHLSRVSSQAWKETPPQRLEGSNNRSGNSYN